MKKTLAIILVIAVLATLYVGSSVLADDNITVEIDGKTIAFDVTPKVIDGRTLVPLRKIFEEIGALVKWNDETQTVSARKSSKTITLAIDSSDLQIDKGKTDDEGNPIVETIALDVPAQLVSGRTLVPVRAISESFGLNVDWDDDNQKVIITSDDKEDDSWKENTTKIDLDKLTYEGKGVEISNKQIKITSGGDYSLTGTLTDGNITISTKEKVKLRLNGVKITSDNPCIFVEDADKAYVTITDGTENTLITKSEDGAIYSKENLEIKGKGTFNIESAGHGIKASDNLTIENGTININAATDGLHINDTFKMTGGTVNITSVGDGIDSESIINISGGTINIETTATPIEKNTENTQETPRRGMWENKTDVEFESSTKGISAEWMMIISGGEITVNSASHTIHCQDEMEISGGTFLLNSKYDKGISAHGNLTISGADTKINVEKSTEGIESKNVLTINDGTINVISTDDALNATGGKTGMMMPGGFGGGNQNNTDGKMPGGNRAPGERNPQNQAGRPNGTPTQQRPVRDENGQIGERRPAGNATTDKPNPYDSNNPNREFTMPFRNNENGEFTPPEWNNEMPPFERGEGGQFTPPADGRPQAPEGGMFPGGNMMGRNAKTCLIINGGNLELCGNDDCIDANGTMEIKGGTIKATNPTGAFTGNFGVLDADGQVLVDENANIILASGSGNERSLQLTQNAVIVYCENQHNAKEKISVIDSKGNTVYEYAPEGNFKTVLIASGKIKTGEKYSIKIGDETFEAEILQQCTVLGTQTSTSSMGFGKWPSTRQ